MEPIIPEVLFNLVGQICCNARVGHAGALVLDFGEKTYYSKRKTHNFIGEWSLRTDSCTWRLNYSGKIMCGFYDEEEENDKLLQKIITLKLIGIEHISPTDIELRFGNNYSVSLIGQSKDADHFGILAPANTFIRFSPINNWYIRPSNIPAEGLNEKEKLLSLHSENCFKRWQYRITECQSEEKCRGCAYYRPLRGEFYFWDYGICSNEKSQFDAKLVGCDSGCEQYSNTLSLNDVK